MVNAEGTVPAAVRNRTLLHMNKKLLLVDGHSLIHRAYHAYPKTLSTRTGELTNAVYGFTNLLLSAIADVVPTHVAVTFDLPKPTFRQSLFTGYKKSRVKPEDELIAQIPRVKQVVKTLNIPIFEVEGFEADDVIGTLSRQAIKGHSGNTSSRVASRAVSLSDRPISKSERHSSLELTGDQFPRRVSPSCPKVIILTSDRDLLQLITDDTVVIKMPERGKKKQGQTASQGPTLWQGRSFPDADIWNERRFIAEWGFLPNLLPDYKALAGDQSDDIPGVHGIGNVTAKKLVSKFGTINDIYTSITEVRDLFKELVAKKLIDDQEAAQLSKTLATIDVNVPIQIDWEAMAIHEYDKDKALALFDELQFTSLVKKLPNDTFEQDVQEALF